MNTHLSEIDRIDRRILDVMQRDGRISNLKLAEAVSLSPTAVLARVQRLTKEGFILGYEARLNPLKLGAGMLVFVEVLLDRTSPNVFEQFKAAVQVHQEIMECHMVAGGFDWVDVRDVVAGILAAADGAALRGSVDREPHRVVRRLVGRHRCALQRPHRDRAPVLFAGHDREGRGHAALYAA